MGNVLITLGSDTRRKLATRDSEIMSFFYQSQMTPMPEPGVPKSQIAQSGTTGHIGTIRGECQGYDAGLVAFEEPEVVDIFE